MVYASRKTDERLADHGLSAGRLDHMEDAIVSMDTINATVVNVKDPAYGAVGDDVTDDTAAMQAALNVGGLIYVPAGTYKLTSALTLRSDTIITGAGSNLSVLHQASTSMHCLSGSAVRRIGIRDLWLKGPSSGSGDGLHLVKGINANVPYISVQSVAVTNFGNDAISIENPIVSNLRVVVANTNGRYGFNLFGTGGAGTSCSLSACYALSSTTAGYRLFNMTYTAFMGCAADSNPIGYLIDSCEGVSLLGCGAESNTTNGFKVTGGNGVTLLNPWVNDNRDVGIYITGSANAVIINGSVEHTPNVSATSYIKTDTGSHVTINSCVNVTANSLAAATTTTADAAGNMTTPGSLYGLPGPASHNLIAWNADPMTCTASGTATNGSVYLMKLHIPIAVTIGTIYWAVATAAVTPTAGQNEIGLFNAAGTKLTSVNIDTASTSIGLKGTTIPAQLLAAGAVAFVALILNAATPATLCRGVGGTVASSLVNVGLTASNYRFAINGTGLTVLPGSITPASNLQGTSWWTGVGL